MKCSRCRFAPGPNSEGYYEDDCPYFDEYGTTWKDGEEGCTQTYSHLKKLDDEYADYLGEMGLEMGMQMDFENHGISMEEVIDHCKHMLGMDNRDTYRRHGKEFYKPYRNYWSGEEPGLEWMSSGVIGLAENLSKDPDSPYYRLTKAGIKWLERRIGVTIRTSGISMPTKCREAKVKENN